MDKERGKLSEASQSTEADKARLLTISSETTSLRNALEARRLDREAQASADHAIEKLLRDEIQEGSAELCAKKAHHAGREAQLVKQTQKLQGLRKHLEERDERLRQCSLELAELQQGPTSTHRSESMGARRTIEFLVATLHRAHVETKRAATQHGC